MAPTRVWKGRSCQSNLLESMEYIGDSINNGELVMLYPVFRAAKHYW